MPVMRKVIFPGPNGDIEAANYSALGVGLTPGENELEDDVAEYLLGLGHVTAVEPQQVSTRISRRQLAADKPKEDDVKVTED